MIEKLMDSLLSQRIIKNQNEPKNLVIGVIDDETSQNIKETVVTETIMKHLINSGKFEVVNAGRDKKVEEMIRDARKMRKDAEYNQYTTIEQGNLISPHYALTGKITERTKSVGENEIKEYMFVFKLTDLISGTVRWVSTERISKKLAKSEVGDYENSKSKNYDYGKYLPNGYAPSYSYTPHNSKKDNRNFDITPNQKEGGFIGVEGGFIPYWDIGIISGYQWYFYDIYLGARLAGHLNYGYRKNYDYDGYPKLHYILLGIAPQFVWDFVNTNSHTLGLYLAPLGFYVRGIFNSKGVDFSAFYEFSAGLNYYYDINHQIYLTFRVFSNNICILGYAYKF